METDTRSTGLSEPSGPAGIIIGISARRAVDNAFAARGTGLFAALKSAEAGNIPIICDRIFFTYLPAELQLEQTHSLEQSHVPHASAIGYDRAGSRREQVTSTLEGAVQFIDQHGSNLPSRYDFSRQLLIGPRREIRWIARQAVRLGLHPVIPADLPSQRRSALERDSAAARLHYAAASLTHIFKRNRLK